MNESMDSFMGAIYRRFGKQPGEPERETAGRREQQELMRRMEGASCSARITGTCGETMEIFLKVDGERIVDATFITDGCGFSVLCGFLATRMAAHRTMDEAAEIGGDTILAALKEVPESESHCAYLAAEALQAAIHNWMVKP